LERLLVYGINSEMAGKVVMHLHGYKYSTLVVDDQLLDRSNIIWNLRARGETNLIFRKQIIAQSVHLQQLEITMQTSARFALPGFKLLLCADNPPYEVEFGLIKVAGQEFQVEIIRRVTTTANGSFLLAAIRNVGGNKLLWKFNKHCPQTGDLIGRLMLLDDEYVIVYTGTGRDGMVEKVLRLSHVLGMRPEDNPLVQARDKLAIGQRIKRPVRYTPTEQAALLAQQRDERATKSATGEHKVVRRKQRQHQLLQRPRITVRTATGRQRDGIPVIESEWPTLPHNTRAILVSWYNHATAEYGDVLETFRVEKSRGGRVKKVEAIQHVFAKAST
jgi:hypothetical protein